MKKFIYRTIGFVAILLVTVSVFAQDRNVVWVHGLNDNANFWQHYDGIFDNERQINGLRRSYTTTSIAAGANSVITEMNRTLGSRATNSQNIGIGHSMGALMIREIDRTAVIKNFGGIITISGSNYGAPIVNSLIDGSVNDAKSDALRKMAAGPTAQSFNLPWAILPQATNYSISEILFNGKIQDYEDDGFDLRVGSPSVDAITNYATTIPQISIWAEETSPVHWRLVSSHTGKNWVKDANTIRDVYNAHYSSNRAHAIVHAFFSPSAAARYFYKSRQWKKGRDWIDNSETIYSSLIQTTRTEPQTYWVQNWEPCDYPQLHQNSPTDLQNSESITGGGDPFRVDEDCGEWVWTERTRHITVNYPSDGFMPQYTQELDVIAGNKYHVQGANHIEVGDMTTDGNGVDETAIEFRKIFNRRPGDFFRTARR